MLSFLSHKPPKRPPPRWMKWALIGFLALAATNGYRAEIGVIDGPKIDDYPVFADFVSTRHWHELLDPSLGRGIEVQEITKGEGDYAACGQQVTLAISAIALQDQDLPKDAAPPEAPVTFTIGDGTKHEAFDRGARGMMRGGVRQILVGARLFDPKADPNLRYPFELKLLALSPYLAAPNRYEAKPLSTGVGTPARCGDTIRAELSMPKQKPAAMLLTIGESSWGHGVDRALIGMRPHDVKQLTLPTEYLPKNTANFPLPITQNTLAQIKRLPYIETEEPPIPTQEPLENEPNRKSSERH